MNKKLLIALIVVAAIVLLIVIIRKANKNKPVSENKSSDTNTSSNIPEFPLRRGIYNSEYVRNVQKALNKISITLGIQKLTEDGDFGPMTELAVDCALSKKQVSIDDYNKYIIPILNWPNAGFPQGGVIPVEYGIGQGFQLPVGA